MRWTLVFTLLATVAGCNGKQRTALVVEVDSNLAVPGELDKIDIAVTANGKTQHMPYSLVGGNTLPLRTALIETTDNTSTLDIVATGSLNGKPTVHEEAVVGFVEGQVMLLNLFLAAECRGDPCTDPTKTCTTGGVCVSKVRLPTGLTPFDTTKPPQDAAVGATRDAGVPDGAGATEVLPDTPIDRARDVPSDTVLADTMRADTLSGDGARDFAPDVRSRFDLAADAKAIGTGGITGAGGTTGMGGIPGAGGTTGMGGIPSAGGCAGAGAPGVGCAPPPVPCASPWGGSDIADGASVTAYQNSSVDCGGTCTSQTRTCANGVLSGAYASQSCSVTPTSGGWSTWADTSACVGGTKSQARSCNSPAPACGGAACAGSATQSVGCALALVPCTSPWGGSDIADGASVTAYQNSSVACGGTCTSQTRTCASGVLSGAYTRQTCSVTPTDGGWSAWADTSVCAASGMKTQQRACDSPAPACGGAACAGLATQSVGCTLPPVACASPWGGSAIADGASVTAYQNSSVACGGSCASQVRTCANGVLSGAFTNQSCSVTPTDGGWGAWADTSECIGGQKSQARSCNSPAPACGGAACAGAATQNVGCAPPPVPCTPPWGGSAIADGASVTAYQSSSVACGSSCTSQVRTCTSGVLSGAYTNQNCSVTPVNGGWSAWVDTSVCAGGKKNQQRTCNSPAPACGGAACAGSPTQIVDCTVACTSPWGGGDIADGGSITAYQSSSVACGSSCTSQIRTCTSGVLSGSYTSQSCSVTPVNGGWGAWVDTSSCISGQKSQQRSCDSPAPACGGAACAGASIQNVGCTVPCASPWGGSNIADGGSITAYQSSSVACGSSCTSQIRTCTSGVLSGSYTNQNCSVTPVNGGWSAWADTSSCTVACGGGTKSQGRSCNNPTPSCGGASCSGSTTQAVACNTQAPIYSYSTSKQCGSTYCQEVTSVTSTQTTIRITRLDNAQFGAWEFIAETYKSPSTHLLGNSSSCITHSGSYSYSYTIGTALLGLSLGQTASYFTRIFTGPSGNNCNTTPYDTGGTSIGWVCP